MSEQIESTMAPYPCRESYRLWSGPNSNTFLAWVAQRVPTLRFDLPPTAIGKNYLGLSTFIDHALNGTGWQFSLIWIAGVTAARDEGLKSNLLGLGFGIDFCYRVLQLLGFGRLP